MSEKKKIITRLKRIEGQIRGITKMIEEDRDCEKVLHQISAARSALYKVGTTFVTANLEDCLKKEANCPPETGEKIKEMMLYLSKFT